MVGTNVHSKPKPAVANPYARKGLKKAKKTTTWNNRWHQTAPANDRKSKRTIVSPNADPMQQVGGCFHYEEPKTKPGTIMPHPSNPTFFLPTQHPSTEEDSSDEDEMTDSEVEVEVVRRISLTPPLAQSQKESPPSSPEKVKIKKEKKTPITATITFDDEDFYDDLVQRVSENIGELMASYYASQSSTKNISSV